MSDITSTPYCNILKNNDKKMYLGSILISYMKYMKIELVITERNDNN